MIREYTDEELQKELDRRSKVLLDRRSKVLQEPVLIEKPDYSPLFNLARDYLEDEREGNEIDTHYAYEVLMETLYKDYFDWVNSL